MSIYRRDDEPTDKCVISTVGSLDCLPAEVPPTLYSSTFSLTNANSNPSHLNNEIVVEHHELRLTFATQAFFPFLLAGCGMVAAGVLLERASNGIFLTEVPEATVLVLALLGLKGNLEMTLASRLSTMTNLGQMDTRKQIFNVLVSNITLVQAQAIVVSLIAALLAIVSHILEGNQFNFARTISLTLTACLTASVASFLLTTLIVAVTIAARRFRVNPDNIATPLAAATGDVTTLILMIWFGTFFHSIRNDHLFLNITILLALFLMTPIMIWMASKHEITLQVLKYGWFAVLLAMFISSAGGYVLRHSAALYPNITLFQPVINGAGGNLVAVQASKISTYLHRFGKLGVLPANKLSTYLNPIRAFAVKEEESAHACILLLMSIPGHIIFVSLFLLVQSSNSFHFDVFFFAFYFTFAVLQVALLLYISQFLTRLIWKLKCNPDNNSIPILTAIGDLLGTVLLAAVFHFHYLVTRSIVKGHAEKAALVAYS